MSPDISLLLFTDLDGTLLDHNDYSSSAAEEALALVKERGVPLITNTSKTLEESRAVQERLGLSGPMIFENGAGVALPVDDWPGAHADLTLDGEYWIKCFATPYADVRHALVALRSAHGYEFKGFGDMTTEDVQQATGLDAESAETARNRRFGEPILWRDSQPRLAEFLSALENEGLVHTRGGRFLHVMGPADKGRAMQWLIGQYPGPLHVVALGDGENDLTMLQAADTAVLVRSPAHELPSFPCGQQPQTLLVPDGFGPIGWNRAVLQIIEEFGHG